MMFHTMTGVLPVAPPMLSRPFHELSRGIVELQNARRIAGNPNQSPIAQVSMILQILHWATTPIASALSLSPVWAVLSSFVSTLVLWYMYFKALDVECRFTLRVNDLPMSDFQREWNKSICTLVDKRALSPPSFDYDPEIHEQLLIA